MNKKEMVSKWLSLFGKSCIFSLNDVNKDARVKKGGFNWSVNHSIDSYLSINEDNPFGLFFTPNGDLGKVNKIGEKLNRSKTDCSNSIYAFYVDIDIKDSEYTSMEKLLNHILTIIREEQLPVSYIVQSGGGYHLYMFVDKQYTKQLQGIKYKEIQEEFAERFSGGDKSSHSLNKLMRLPYSKHWKSLTGIPLKLFRIYNEPEGIEIEEVISEDQIEFPFTTIHKNYLINLSKNISEKNDIRIDLVKADTNKQVSDDINIINNVELIRVIKTLEKKYEEYPKDYLGYRYKFILKGNKINFQITNLTDGTYEDVTTEGYRINLEENFVNNFSGENHPIEERPRGGTFSFLYYYFDKDIGKVKEFLEKEFGIILKQKKNFGYLNIKTFNGIIVFSKEGVFYNKEIKSKNGIDMVQKTLFEIPIEIVGVFSSKYTAYGEADHNHNYYLIRRLDNVDEGDNQIIVNFNVDRKSFNKTYGSTGLVFFGGEEDMLSFYSALNKASIAGQVPTLQFEYLNGFKKDKLILGNNVYDKDFNIINDDKLVLKTQNIDLNILGKTECSVKEFADRFLRLFKHRVSVLSISTYITLFLGHDFWSCIGKFKQQALIPGLIVSGKTRAGKTTLLSILKEGSGLSIDTRKFSIKSTTPQPLKQAGTDSFILHLEEFTGDINPDKETIIRDILNKSITAKGTLSGENVSFVYRSSLILDGERLPVSQSVVNRTVLIPMFEEDKTGNEEMLYDIKDFLYLPDLTKKALTITEDDKVSAFKKAEQVLLEKGIRGRNVLLFSFVLATNYLIKIVDNKILLDTIKENFKLLGQANVDGDDLSSILSHIIITNRIRPSFDYASYEDSNKSKLVGSITLNSEVLAEKRIDIINVLRKYEGEIELDGFTLIFNTDKLSNLGVKLLQYRQYFNFIS